MPCAPCPRRLVGIVLLASAWSAVAAAQERDVTPVIDAMLQDPASGDRLMWRRTLDGWGF